MGFGIRYAIDDKKAILEVRAYLGVPFASNLENNQETTCEVRNIVSNNLNSVFNVFPGVADKFLSGVPSIKICADKDHDTLYFVLSGYKAYKVERLEEFMDFFCNVIIEEVCRRSVFDIGFGVKQFLIED